MSRLCKSELKRSFCNPSFLISILLSTSLVLWYSVERIPFCLHLNSTFSVDKMLDNFLEVSYTNWIGSHNIFLQQNIFYLLIPFFAVLPFGGSFFADINSGYIKGICIRAEKKHYLLFKYNAVFISGGVAAVIPMVLSFLISSAFLPTMLPESSYLFTNIYSGYKWADLFFIHPFLYVLLYIALVFLFSGLISCSALVITYFSNKVFLPMIFPFFIYISASLFCEVLNLNGFSIRAVLTTTGERGSTAAVILLAGILFILTFFPYYMIGAKRDVV